METQIFTNKCKYFRFCILVNSSTNTSLQRKRNRRKACTALTESDRESDGKEGFQGKEEKDPNNFFLSTKQYCSYFITSKRFYRVLGARNFKKLFFFEKYYFFEKYNFFEKYDFFEYCFLKQMSFLVVFHASLHFPGCLPKKILLLWCLWYLNVTFTFTFLIANLKLRFWSSSVLPYTSMVVFWDFFYFPDACFTSM